MCTKWRMFAGGNASLLDRRMKQQRADQLVSMLSPRDARRQQDETAAVIPHPPAMPLYWYVSTITIFRRWPLRQISSARSVQLLSSLCSALALAWLGCVCVSGGGPHADLLPHFPSANHWLDGPHPLIHPPPAAVFEKGTHNFNDSHTAQQVCHVITVITAVRRILFWPGPAILILISAIRYHLRSPPNPRPHPYHIHCHRLSSTILRTHLDADLCLRSLRLISSMRHCATLRQSI